MEQFLNDFTLKPKHNSSPFRSPTANKLALLSTLLPTRTNDTAKDLNLPQHRCDNLKPRTVSDPISTAVQSVLMTYKFFTATPP